MPLTKNYYKALYIEFTNPRLNNILVSDYMGALANKIVKNFVKKY